MAAFLTDLAVIVLMMAGAFTVGVLGAAVVLGHAATAARRIWQAVCRRG